MTLARQKCGGHCTQRRTRLCIMDKSPETPIQQSDVSRCTRRRRSRRPVLGPEDRRQAPDVRGATTAATTARLDSSRGRRRSRAVPPTVGPSVGPASRRRGSVGPGSRIITSVTYAPKEAPVSSGVSEAGTRARPMTTKRRAAAKLAATALRPNRLSTKCAATDSRSEIPGRRPSSSPMEESTPACADSVGVDATPAAQGQLEQAQQVTPEAASAPETAPAPEATAEAPPATAPAFSLAARAAGVARWPRRHVPRRGRHGRDHLAEGHDARGGRRR